MATPSHGQCLLKLIARTCALRARLLRQDSNSPPVGQPASCWSQSFSLCYWQRENPHRYDYNPGRSIKIQEDISMSDDRLARAISFVQAGKMEEARDLLEQVL